MEGDNPLLTKAGSKADHREKSGSLSSKERNKFKIVLNSRKLWQKPEKICKRLGQEDKSGTVGIALMRYEAKKLQMYYTFVTIKHPKN